MMMTVLLGLARGLRIVIQVIQVLSTLPNLDRTYQSCCSHMMHACWPTPETSSLQHDQLFLDCHMACAPTWVSASRYHQPMQGYMYNQYICIHTRMWRMLKCVSIETSLLLDGVTQIANRSTSNLSTC